VIVGGNVSDSVAQKILRTDPVAHRRTGIICRDPKHGQQPSSPVAPLPTPAQPAAVTAPRLLDRSQIPRTSSYVEIDLKSVASSELSHPR